MPCHEMLEFFDKAMEEGLEYYQLPDNDPFALAVMNELATQNIRGFFPVRMYSKEKLTVQVEMNERDVYGFMQRVRKVVSLKVVELHEMAVQFLPKIEELKVTERTFQNLRKYFHPGVPRDLLDQPFDAKREFVKIELSDGYMYEEVWK